MKRPRPFVSPDAPSTVTMIANGQPFEEPNGCPNFYPFATDTVHDIDNNGDAKADITYRWTFQSTWQNLKTISYDIGPVTSISDSGPRRPAEVHAAADHR